MGEEKSLSLTKLKDGSAPLGVESPNQDADKRLATIRRTTPKDELEVDEFCMLAKTITEIDVTRGDIALRRQVAWSLFVLAIYAITVLLLLGLGVIALPTALAAAIIGPLLSGVVGLLGLLVKSIFR